MNKMGVVQEGHVGILWRHELQSKTQEIKPTGLA
jgi:hypothetical protein